MVALMNQTIKTNKQFKREETIEIQTRNLNTSKQFKHMHRSRPIQNRKTYSGKTKDSIKMRRKISENIYKSPC